MKLKIIAVSSIQHHNKRRAAGTCGTVAGIEDAILFQIMPGILGYSIELAHKGGDTGIRTRHNRMHRKAQPAAGASTRLRPVSATRQMPIVLMGFC